MGFLSGKKDKKLLASKPARPTVKAEPAAEQSTKLTDENAKNLARMLQIYMKENRPQ